MTAPRKLQKLIFERKRAKFDREARQTEIFAQADMFKSTVEAKLTGIATGPGIVNFYRCGHEPIFCTCTKCHKTETFAYACNRKYCPRCSPKLAKLRIAKLKIWASKITQPKHLVLTMRNFPVLTGRKIREFQKALLQLRKRELWREVKGGCATIEITNSGEGWHLHAHLLLDVRWLDMSELAKVWGNLVGQQFGIVKIKDVRGQEYLAEVAKYVVKGNELAKWEPEQIWEFICAIRGKRFFFAFGSLFQMTKEIKRELLRQRADGKTCECGSSEFIYETEADAILGEIRRAKGEHHRKKNHHHTMPGTQNKRRIGHPGA
jgi:hypothetical protein